MAIMKCPKCDGSGSFWTSQEGTASAGYMSTCPSCGGTGYVTDGVNYVNAPMGSPVTIWIKCPHCGKQIEIKQYQYQSSYVAVEPLIN